jgi:hypothetical protein
MCRAQQVAEKRCRVVILRSQQATKNLHLLETTECRSFAQKARLRMTAFAAFFRSLSSPALHPKLGQHPVVVQFDVVAASLPRQMAA